ncbi:MAG TPA: metal ABC transporter permease [Candidatus Cloacimonadota bacterium]|nr:metal ABC transporter permease [Candidatus Cloacimonadota bacterium]
MFSFLTIEILLFSFIAGILSAISTSLLSVFVTLKKISYMSEALSHISFAGIALAILLGLSLNITSTIFVLFIVAIILYISLQYNLEESNVTMLLMSVSMAVGIILLSFKKDYVVDVSSYMFGNILLINKEDLYWLTALIIINLLFIIAFYREIIYTVYHASIAEFYHVPAKLITVLLLTILGINIAISVKITGIVMITAQLILPGMISLNITRTIPKAIIISVLFSAFASAFGFLLSFHFNLPSGAVIVVVLFVLFLLSLSFKRLFLKEH